MLCVPFPYWVHTLLHSPVDSPIYINTYNIFYASFKEKLCSSYSCCSYTCNYNFYVIQFLLHYFKSVKECSKNNNSSTVLVVMDYWNIFELHLQSLFNLEASRRGNILEVYSPKCWRDYFYGLYYLFYILCC